MQGSDTGCPTRTVAFGARMQPIKSLPKVMSRGGRRYISPPAIQHQKASTEVGTHGRRETAPLGAEKRDSRGGGTGAAIHGLFKTLTREEG